MHIVRRGGQYAGDQQRLYKVKAVVSALAGSVLLFSSVWVLGFIFFVLGFIVFGFSLHYLTRFINWRKGILGERLVIEALTPLDNSYVLINDVVLPKRKGNIDHILIGPTGLFVIETKNYRRLSYFNRFPIRQVIRNAVSLRYFLKEYLQLDVFVNALLVFTEPDITISQNPPIFHVRNIGNLCDFIKGHKTRSVLNHNITRDMVHEILRVSRLSEKEVDIKKWLLKPASAVGLILVAYTFWTLSGGNPYSEWVLVTRVIDGDTIHVGRGWMDTTVRLLGVDTSETVHPYKPVEFFGPEASEFTKRHLEGRKVRLEFEPSKQYDDYDRLLAYVFLPNGTLFNAELIKQGYAHVIAPSPFRYYNEFRSYEQEAMAAGVGLWAANDICREIVGNMSSKIYRLPGDAGCGRVKEEKRVYFNTEEEAIKAGYRRAKR